MLTEQPHATPSAPAMSAPTPAMLASTPVMRLVIRSLPVHGATPSGTLHNPGAALARFLLD